MRAWTCPRRRAPSSRCPRAATRSDPRCVWFFFFNDTATTEIYTLSLHDALPICGLKAAQHTIPDGHAPDLIAGDRDRKSTRLNSSHITISYAVFCLKKKKRE